MSKESNVVNTLISASFLSHIIYMLMLLVKIPMLLHISSSGRECNVCCGRDCGENGDCDFEEGDIPAGLSVTVKDNYTIGDSGEYCDEMVTSLPLSQHQRVSLIIVCRLSFSLSFLVRP